MSDEDRREIVHDGALGALMEDLIESPHRGKVRIEALYRSFGLAAQTLENEIFYLLTSLNVELATGYTLDVLGKLEAWPRNGLNDDDYRQTIKAIALANVSDGSAEDMVAMMKAAFDTDSVLWHETESPMTQHLQAYVDRDYDDQFRRRVRELMERGKTGGTKLMLTQAVAGGGFQFDTDNFDSGAFGIAF